MVLCVKVICRAGSGYSVQSARTGSVFRTAFRSCRCIAARAACHPHTLWGSSDQVLRQAQDRRVERSPELVEGHERNPLVQSFLKYLSVLDRVSLIRAKQRTLPVRFL